MAIYSLRITDFRNLSAVELFPSQNGLNVIYGENGSGKTSLLEAIHYLSTGKSLRGTPSRRLIRHSCQQFSLFAKLLSLKSPETSIGIEKKLSGRMRSKLGEALTPSLIDLAQSIPIRVIHSQSHQFFESGPIFRRKYLDWGLFYQSEAFLTCWHHYMRRLRQRNAAFRQQRSKKEIEVWTTELVKYGEMFDVLRCAYVDALIPLMRETAAVLLPICSLLEVNYLPGWDKQLDLASALEKGYQDELRFGCTQYGPHRADMEITLQGVPVRHILSRGQQKLLICAMIIAQGMLFASETKKDLIYLVDDLPAELDCLSRTKLIALLSQQKTQVFITAIESQTICDVINGANEFPTRVFHVEHGKLFNI